MNMEGLLTDQTQLSSRRVSTGGGAEIVRPRYMSLDPSSVNQHLPNHQPQQPRQTNFYGSLPPTFSFSHQFTTTKSPPNYSTAPLLQPPLLPLPPRPRGREKPAVAASSNRRKGNSKEEVLPESSVYSLSPPPSTLPLPSFLLTKQKDKGVGDP